MYQYINLNYRISQLRLNEQPSDAFSILRDIARFASIGVAVTLIAYLVSRKIRMRRERRNKADKNAQ